MIIHRIAGNRNKKLVFFRSFRKKESPPPKDRGLSYEHSGFCQLLQNTVEAAAGPGQLLDLDILVPHMGQRLQRGAEADGGNPRLAAEMAAVGAEGEMGER